MVVLVVGSFFGITITTTCTEWLTKVGRSKPGVVLTGNFNRPGQYSRSGQYWLIGGQLRFLAVI